MTQTAVLAARSLISALSRILDSLESPLHVLPLHLPASPRGNVALGMRHQIKALQVLPFTATPL